MFYLGLFSKAAQTAGKVPLVTGPLGTAPRWQGGFLGEADRAAIYQGSIKRVWNQVVSRGRPSYQLGFLPTQEADLSMPDRDARLYFIFTSASGTALPERGRGPGRGWERSLQDQSSYNRQRAYSILCPFN